MHSGASHSVTCMCLPQVAKGNECTALYAAAYNGYDKVVSFLLAKGASPRIGATDNVS